MPCLALLALFDFALGMPGVGLGALAPSPLLLAVALMAVLMPAARWPLAVLLAAVTALVEVDATHEAFFGRGIDVTVDARVMPRALLMLLEGFPGKGPLAITLVVAAALALLGLSAWLTGLLRGLGEAVGRRRGARWVASAGALCATLSLGLGGPALDPRPATVIAAQVEALGWAQARREAMLARMADDPLPPAAAPVGSLHVLFVESYGAALLGEPGAGRRLGLDGLAARVAGSGRVVLTAKVAAPIVGGRSWLSHATVLSGVMIGSDAWLDALAASGRETLAHRMRRAGRRTVAFGPGMRGPWRHREAFGFDEVHDSDAFDYRGPPFGALTIPDEVIAARAAAMLAEGERPFLAVLPLVSSHWPWGAVPKPAADWAEIGRGEGIAPVAPQGSAGERYRRGIAYALGAAFAYAAHAAELEDTVMILGDHPPAAFLTDRPRERAVPVHVVVPEARAAAWRARGFRDGLLPSPRGPVAPMSAVPRWLLE